MPLSGGQQREPDHDEVQVGCTQGRVTGHCQREGKLRAEPGHGHRHAPAPGANGDRGEHDRTDAKHATTTSSDAGHVVCRDPDARSRAPV